MANLLQWLDYHASVGSEIGSYLGYPGSDDVREYDLVSEERRELYRHESSLDVPITAVDETSFIIGGSFAGGGSGMLLIGADGRAHELGRGGSQVYFPAHGKLLYLASPPGEYHAHLYEATLRENRLESPRVGNTIYGPVYSSICR